MNIFPKPSSLQIFAGRFDWKEKSGIYAIDDAVQAAVLLKKRLIGKYGIKPENIMTNCSKPESRVLFLAEAMKKEHYRICVSEDKIQIFAADRRGFVHGVETLLQMVEEDLTVPCVSLYDGPYKKWRGMHLYMPSPEHLEECKRLFDVLSFLKYNTIILEVGGTMELKRHPEINRAWTAFCETVVRKFPGGPQNFQWSDSYWKDSTHYENARGKILTQEEVRDLVQYAKILGFTVIPEIQALSHCYYLTMAHREIAENADDLFPDTFCPMNEESYKLYFEVAEEILEVIEPEVVSIGHDEIRVMGVCPVCRQKSGHELLAYEINRLYDFYKARNIRIMMWSDSLLQPFPKYHITRGGKETNKVDDYGRHYRLPMMYEAIEALPKDILMQDWFYSQSPNTEECFIDKGFETVFGNFTGVIFGNWDERGARTEGAEISTWCPPEELILGRNGILFDLIFSAQLLWNEGYDDSKYEEYVKSATEEAEAVRNVMRGDYPGMKLEKKQTMCTEILYYNEEGIYPLDMTKAVCCGSNAKKIAEKCPKLVGAAMDTAHILLRTDFYADSLLLCESFKKQEEQFMSYSFINTNRWEESPMSDSDYICTNMPRWSAATHEILYEDGSWELVNAVYGITAAAVNMSYGRDRLYLDEKVNEIDDTPEKVKGQRTPGPLYKLKDNWMPSVLYFSDIIKAGDSTAYVYEWKNPHPEKKIVCIKCVSTTHDKEQSAILYAIGYKVHK